MEKGAYEANETFLCENQVTFLWLECEVEIKIVETTKYTSALSMSYDDDDMRN